MYQIDVATAAATRPAASAPGTAGWFTDGNPSTLTPATIFPAEFVNMLMAELLAILTAGGITPSKTTSNQVLSALNVMYQVAALDAGTKYRMGTASGCLVQIEQ